MIFKHLVARSHTGSSALFKCVALSAVISKFLGENLTTNKQARVAELWCVYRANAGEDGVQLSDNRTAPSLIVWLKLAL